MQYCQRNRKKSDNQLAGLIPHRRVEQEEIEKEMNESITKVGSVCLGTAEKCRRNLMQAW